MVAYVLPSYTDETPIRTGRRFALLAKPRPAGSRNPHVGPSARVHLSIAGNRETPSRAMPTARCVYSALVSFSADGVVRILDAEAPRSTAPGASIGEGLANHLANAEQGSPRDRSASADAVAAACGYPDYAALWADIRRHDGEIVARQIIGWGPEA